MKYKFITPIIIILALVAVLVGLSVSRPAPKPSISVTTTTQPIANQGPNLGWGQPLEYTLFPNDGVLYHAEGSKIIKEVVSQTSTSRSTLVDVDKNILNFNVSADRLLLAYSVRVANPSPDAGQAGISKAGTGDTIIIRNLNSGLEFIIYSDPQDENFEIKSIKFSPDGKRLLFTNNFLGIFDLQTRRLEKYNDHRDSRTCPTQSIQDISEDGSEILLLTPCSEGGYQQIFNTRNATAIQVPGYIGERSWLYTLQAFVSNTTLIGSHRGTSTTEAMVYDVQAKPIRTISGPIEEFIPFIDNISDSSKIFFGIYTDIPIERAIEIYSLDRSTLEVDKVQEKKMLIIENGSDRWLTNNHLEKPTLITD